MKKLTTTVVEISIVKENLTQENGNTICALLAKQLLTNTYFSKSDLDYSTSTSIYWHSCGPKAEQLDKTRKGLKDEHNTINLNRNEEKGQAH